MERPVPDFLDEVQAELREAYGGLAQDRHRIADLEELERVVLDLGARLRRPVTVFDVILMADADADRERRRALVGTVRRLA